MIQERSEVVAKLLRGVGGRFQGHICFSVPQHVWYDDSVSLCDPRMYLVSPAVPQVREAMETKQGCCPGRVVYRLLIYVVIRPTWWKAHMMVAEVVWLHLESALTSQTSTKACANI